MPRNPITGIAEALGTRLSPTFPVFSTRGPGTFVIQANGPPAPSLTLVVNSSSQITATIGSVVGATGYNLRYSAVSTAGPWTTLTNVTSPVAVSGLTANTQYWFQTQATPGGAWSASATARTFLGIAQFVTHGSNLPMVTFGTNLPVVPA